MTACSGSKTEPAAPATETPAYTKVDPATAAAVAGKILFTGKPPAAKTISMQDEAACARLHQGRVREDEVVVNPNGTLANVFVHVVSGLEGKNFEPPSGSVVIDQRGCLFRPHVLGIRAGQTLVVSNSDPVTHNIHPLPKNNREWNQSQAPDSGNLEREFARPEVMIPVKCNVHAWMRAYIGVVEHPFFAVSGEEGTFQLKGLPPGEYTLQAWHEVYGTLDQKVSLGSSASQSVEFTFAGR